MHWIGLQSVAAIAVPAGFLLGWAGTVVGRRRARPDEADDRWDARVLAGVRADWE